MTMTPTGPLDEEENNPLAPIESQAAEAELTDGMRQGYEEYRQANPDEPTGLSGSTYNQEQAAKLPDVEPEPKQDVNPLQEFGTAILGAGIDSVEGLGGTAQMLAQGQLLNPDFKPTWLQVDNNVEPMNKTGWGRFLRRGLEFGISFVGVGKFAKLAQLGLKGVKGLQAGRTGINLAKYANLGATTARGQKISNVLGGSVRKGAAATFMSEYSLESTLNDDLKELMPWWTLTSTSDESSPLERKAKHVLEDLGMGAAGAKVFGWLGGLRIAKKIDKGLVVPPNPKLVAKAQSRLQEVDELLENIDIDAPNRSALVTERIDLQKTITEAFDAHPDIVAKQIAAEITESQDDALFKQIELDLGDGITGAKPSLHPDFFDAPDRGLRGVREGSFYRHMKDMLDMESRGDFAAGRRARLITDANITRISRDNKNLAKLVRTHAEEIQRGLEIPAGRNVAGLKTSMTGVKQLAIAKYSDIVSTFPEVAKGDWDVVSKMLMEDAIEIPNVRGGTTKVLSSSNTMALEMVMHDLNAAVADKAMALHSLAGKVPAEEGISNLLTKVEAAFLMNQESSEFAGSLLRARRGDKMVARTADGVAAASKREKLTDFMGNLKTIMKSDPELTETFLRAFAETNGDVVSMEALRRYATNRIFNVKSLLGVQGARSEFVDGLFNTLYNSILSAPKTMARAFSGTALLTVMKPLTIALGGAMSGDRKTMAKGLHMGFDGMFGTIGEAWTLASRTHTSLVKNQFGPYVNQLVSPAETIEWKNLGKVIETEGNTAEIAMYRLTSTIKDFNNQSWVRYPSNAMATIDSFSKTLIGRQELKARAFDAAWDASNGQVSKEMVQRYERQLRDTIFNSTGEVVDTAAEYAGKEAALQLPLQGKLGELESLLQSTPLLRPFFLFMKTGANAISVVSKHTPILARFNDDVRSILNATPQYLDKVRKYGITDAGALAQAKAQIRGRIATGYMTVGAATGLYMTGRLTGNGPPNRELRNAWVQSGKWRPRSIKLGGKWVNYDGLEPFASFLALVADVGDASTDLGQTATEDMFRKMGYLIGMNITNKSFLSGLQPLTDVLAFDGVRSETWAANLTNNFIPFAGIRNELANVFNPGFRELDRDFRSTIMNRNVGTRGALPLQYDPLDGSVIRLWDWPTRLWNSISPIQISGTDTPTRRLLRESGFDLATTFKTDSKGNRLEPEQRSRMMQLMGELKPNIETQLESLFKNKQIKAEIKKYRDLRENGVPGKDLEDPQNMRIEDSLFFDRINAIFKRAKSQAEAQLFQEQPSLRGQASRREAARARQGVGLVDQAEQLLKSTKNK